MKGIILAGGSGTRLYPVTRGVSKQLLPVYDKPLIYYPFSVLMLAGLKEILIITTPQDRSSFENVLGDGSALGINLSYAVQPSPDGLAQAFIIGRDFIGSDDVCLVLGDNIFFGHSLTNMLKNSVRTVEQEQKAVVFGYYVHDPQRYGVVAFDDHGIATSIEEKPATPRSSYAVTGLYFYPNDVVQIAAKVKPSQRGELEITAVNEAYLKKERLKVELMGRGYAWLDTGTHESLLEAGNFIATIEKRQGLKVACLEEIALEMGYIDTSSILQIAEPLKKNQYGQYLQNLAKRK